MPDQPKSTPPTEFELPPEPEPLRHALTWRFTDPDDREALVRVLELIVAHMNEVGEWGPNGMYESVTVGELAAAAADLMARSADLARISQDPAYNEVTGRELQLCYAAKEWAAEVANLVERMTTLLHRPHRPPEPDMPDPNGERKR